MRMPSASARSAARRITGPSASGSENGKPTSTMSAPPSTAALASSGVAGTGHQVDDERLRHVWSTARMCWPQESAPGSEASCTLDLDDELAQLRLVGVERRQQAGGGGGHDRAVPREQLFELAPAEEPHRQVAVVLALRAGRPCARSRRSARRRRGGRDRAAREVKWVTAPTSDMTESSTWPPGRVTRHELGDALLGAVDEVADRAAVADGGVEAPVVELLQVERRRRRTRSSTRSSRPASASFVAVQLQLPAARGRRRRRLRRGARARS